MRPHCCGATPGCVPKAWRVWAQLCPLSLSPHLASLASGDKEGWGIPRSHTALLKARPGTHRGRVQVGPHVFRARMYPSKKHLCLPAPNIGMWQLLLKGLFINQTKVWSSRETQTLKAVIGTPCKGTVFFRERGFVSI